MASLLLCDSFLSKTRSYDLSECVEVSLLLVLIPCTLLWVTLLYSLLLKRLQILWSPPRLVLSFIASVSLLFMLVLAPVGATYLYLYVVLSASWIAYNLLSRCQRRVFSTLSACALLVRFRSVLGELILWGSSVLQWNLLTLLIYASAVAFILCMDWTESDDQTSRQPV